MKPPFAAYHFPSVSTALVTGLERSNGMAPPSTFPAQLRITIGLFNSMRQYAHGVPQPVFLPRFGALHRSQSERTDPGVGMIAA